ncbi:hypothetical protein FOZ63_011418, partial [Perkinsus olseni]
TALEVLADASLVVGLHSDQATERIVDFALAAGKPFAVVPCCVYQKCFPDRKLPDGQLVSTYEEFITGVALTNTDFVPSGDEVSARFLRSVPYACRDMVVGGSGRRSPSYDG